MAFYYILNPEHDLAVRQLIEDTDVDTADGDFVDTYLDMFTCFLYWRVQDLLTTQGQSDFSRILNDCLQGYHIETYPQWWEIGRYWDHLAWQLLTQLPPTHQLDFMGTDIQADVNAHWMVTGLKVTFAHETA